MRKMAVGLACTVLLGGCAAPLAVHIASLLANGASLAFSEKTVGDHGISLVAQKDCAMWRVVTEQEVCREDAPVVVAGGLSDQILSPADEAAWLAAAAAAPGVETAVLPFVLAEAPESQARSDIGKVRPARAVKAPARIAAASRASYFVIGSFAKEGDAKSLVRRHTALAPSVVSARVDGRKRYRVLVGPFGEGDREKVRRRVTAAGFARAWLIPARG